MSLDPIPFQHCLPCLVSMPLPAESSQGAVQRRPCRGGGPQHTRGSLLVPTYKYSVAGPQWTRRTAGYLSTPPEGKLLAPANRRDGGACPLRNGIFAAGSGYLIICESRL